MKKTFGFIGCGNMGGALAAAACRGAGAENVMLSDHAPEKAMTLFKEYGCCASDNQTIASRCDYVFLGVKPQMMAEMLSSIAPALAGRTAPVTLVTMAAGLSMETILSMAGGEYPIIRIMPNTPCSVGAGMVLYCTRGVDEAALADFLAAMAPAGRFDFLPENLIDAASGVSGCGPAYAYLFLEGLADGAVACGLPRQKALEYAAQTLLGAATLALSSGKHPGELKDSVCSPGGTTIQGVRALEQRGFRSACMEAVIAAFEKNAQLAKG